MTSYNKTKKHQKGRGKADFIPKLSPEIKRQSFDDATSGRVLVRINDKTEVWAHPDRVEATREKHLRLADPFGRKNKKAA